MVLTTHSAFAQMETTTTTTRSGGTITSLSPDSLSVRTETSAVPVHYSFTKTTTYVDENGNPISVETVRSGTPVTVYYDREGDQMVARKVVLLKAPTVVTRETSPIARDSNAQVAGTVTDFTPTNFTVRTETSASPVSYSYTRTTTYVDENGNPVSSETVRSGAPVTIFYDYEGGKPVASKVVVHKVVSATPEGTIIEQKKTTTTTTTTTDEKD
jgi:hypothetical protein